MADEPKNAILALNESTYDPPPQSFNAISALNDPGRAYAPKVLEQAQRDNWTRERIESGLKEVGADPADYKHIYEPLGKLNEERKNLQGTPVSTSQAFRRSFMPFSDLTSLNFLPDVPDAINPKIGGAPQFGGRVVGNAEYADAVEKFRSGKASDKDLNAIAVYEHAQGVDERIKKDATFGQKLTLEVGGLGKIGAEMGAGGGLLGAAGKGIGALRGTGQVASAATAAAAPAVPAAASWVSQAATYAGLKVPQLALTPSLYVPMAQQRNTEEGRKPNDPRGYPAAVAYGYANLLVLGKLQTPSATGGGLVSSSFKKGALGMAELQAVDAAAGVADELLPKAWKFGTKYGTLGRLAEAYNRDDQKAVGDELAHATVQLLAFSAFAGIHRGIEGKPLEPVTDPLMEAYKGAIDARTKQGYSRNAVGQQLVNMHDRVNNALDANPDLDQQGVRDLFADVKDPALRNYGDKLADAFRPRPEQPAAPAEAPKPEVAAVATEPAATVPSAPAEPGKIAAFPGETHADFVERLGERGVSEADAVKLADAWGLDRPKPAADATRPEIAQDAPKIPSDSVRPEPLPTQPEGKEGGKTEVSSQTSDHFGVDVPPEPVAPKRVRKPKIGENPDSKPVTSLVPEELAAVATSDATKNRSAETIDWQKQWDSYTVEEFADLPDEVKRVFREHGVDVSKQPQTAVRDAGDRRRGKTRPFESGKQGEKTEVDTRIADIIDGTNALNAQEKQVLKERLSGRSQEEVSASAGAGGGSVSKTRVQAIEKAALRKLRKLIVDRMTDDQLAELDLPEKSELLSALDKQDATVEQMVKQINAFTSSEGILREKGQTYDPLGDAAGEGGWENWTHRLFTKIGENIGPGPKRLLNWIVGQFKGAPEAIKKLDAERQGQIAAHAEDARNSARDLDRAVLQHVIGRSPTILDRVAAAVRPPQLDAPTTNAVNALLRTGTADQNYQAVRAAVPEALRGPVDAMRSHVDTLSDALIKSGAISEKLIPIIEQNKGTYLTRAYRIFLPKESAKWLSEIPEEVKNRFLSVTAERIIADEGAPAATPERIQSILDAVLGKGGVPDSPGSLVKGGKLGAKDLSILKPRGEFIPELRALWGEVTEPGAAYAITVGKQSQLLANQLFLSKVAALGESAGIHGDYESYRRATGEAGVLLAEADNKAMGPLAGKIGSPQLKAALDNAFNPQVGGPLVRAYAAILGAAKYSKTVLSHAGWAANLLGNVGIAVRNGYWRIGHVGETMRTVFADTPAARDARREMIERGVLGEGVHAGEFQKITESIFGKERAEAERTGYESIVGPKQLLNLFKRGFDLAGRGYRAMDAVWKVYGYLNEQSRYRKAFPEWTDAQVNEKAAEVVRDTQPTYSKISPIIKGTRLLPVAPFVSFPAEVVRNTYHSVRLAFTEIADPKTRGIGYTRLAGLAAAATSAAGLSMLTKYLTGMSDEDEEAMRRLNPEYKKNGQILHLGKRDNGDPITMDMSRLDAHSVLTEPVIAALRPGTPEERAKRAATAAAKPFTNEELAVGAFMDWRRNRNSFDKPIYNPEDSNWQQTKDVVTHLAQPFVPGSYSSARKLGMAESGDKEQKSGKEYRTDEELPAQFAVQPQTLERKKLFTGKAEEFQKRKNEDAKILNETIKAKGVVTDQELKDARQREEAARVKTYEDFALDVKAAERLGLTTAEIVKAMKEAGVSESDRKLILSGNYRTMKPDIPKPQTGGTPEQRQRAVDVKSGATDKAPEPGLFEGKFAPLGMPNPKKIGAK